MSFSQQVKGELFEQFPMSRHCRIAEIAAIFALNGKIVVDKGNISILKLQTESENIAKRFSTMVNKTFDAESTIIKECGHGERSGVQYVVTVKEPADVTSMVQACKISQEGHIDRQVVERNCCKRSAIRGTFLCNGSVNNPEKAYHFEIAVPNEELGETICYMLRAFSADAKMISRKSHYVVYVKESSQIVDILNVMEAHVALMEFENVRILKEVRNSVNRQVNCEAANINKTVKAAGKQIEDILYIRDSVGLERLSEGLAEVAQLRIENPEASLKELGEMLCPTVGKSGVNHRLKRISEFADNLRMQ